MNEQLLPLATLAVAEDGEMEGITRFQKLVFLAQRERDGAEPYEFRADDYGPFSPDLYDDIDQLVAADLIDYDEQTTDIGNTKQVYSLTETGRRAVENSDTDDFPVSDEELAALGDEFEDVDLWDLLEYVYTEYPRMARNSELSLV